MSKRLLSLFFSTIILIGISVPAYAYEDERTGTPYEILEKEGVLLKHFIITFKSKNIETGYYRAVSSSGETLRFKYTDAENELFIGDRIRTYWTDNVFYLAERVKQELINYKITNVWNEHGSMYFEGISDEHGEILFTEENVAGREIMPGDVVTVEFDRMFIENGLIVAYKKK